MNLSELMQLFSSSATIHHLEISDKILASLVTTLLGMGITFSALIVLLFIISWMQKLFKSETEVKDSAIPSQQKPETDEEEIVAAISSALIMKIQEGNSNNIIIRNIRRVDDFHPQWSKAGIRNQLDSTLNR